jgi:hypothetical protein
MVKQHKKPSSRINTPFYPTRNEDEDNKTNKYHSQTSTT